MNTATKQKRLQLTSISLAKFKERLKKRNPAYLTYHEIGIFLNLRSGSRLIDEIRNRALGICEWDWVTKIGLEDLTGIWMGSWMAKFQPMKSKNWWKKIRISLRSEYCSSGGGIESPNR